MRMRWRELTCLSSVGLPNPSPSKTCPRCESQAVHRISVRFCKRRRSVSVSKHVMTSTVLMPHHAKTPVHLSTDCTGNCIKECGPSAATLEKKNIDSMILMSHSRPILLFALPLLTLNFVPEVYRGVSQAAQLYTPSLKLLSSGLLNPGSVPPFRKTLNCAREGKERISTKGGWEEHHE
jgi:hypothetical protein